jgi:nucleoside-diphosphate-sugar epimerase
MKILVTGSSGFVGKNLLGFLVHNGIDSDGISMRQANWRSRVWNNYSAIIHLAGKAHDTSNTIEKSEYFKINRDLTIELFNEFLNSEVNDFIYFSSVKAVADSVDGVLKEDIEGNPFTPYGQSKLQAEQYLLSKKLPNDKRLFIIRPCMIHGPGNKGNLNLLYNFVNKGIPWPLAAFENKRSFLSIDNLNYIITSILKDFNLASGVYNLSDDESLSTNELIKLISTLNGNKARLLKIPPLCIQGLAKIGDKLGLPLNTERLKKLTESYEVSNSKLKTALNIQKLPISAMEGLVKTLKSF